MIRLSALLLAAAAGAVPWEAVAQAMPTSQACVECHLTLADERLSMPATEYAVDVHAEAGFGCLACHGAGAEGEAGFLRAPRRTEIPELCGRCHSDAAFMRSFNPTLRVDQVSEYWSSEHGRALRERGDADVATCNDCHPAHSIRAPSDPESTVFAANIVGLCGSCHSDQGRMSRHLLGTNQVDEYSAGIHGRMLLEEGDLSAPACNDCHGNHGAAPPGFRSVRNVCGQCHSVMADYFAESGHVEVFEDEDLPGCAHCHAHHAVDPVNDADLMSRSEDVCFACHAESEAAASAFEHMATLLDSLDVEAERSRALLEVAENAGMEVSQALFELEGLGTIRTQARSAIHTFTSERVLEASEPGFELVALVGRRGTEAMEEHAVRRVGLGAFSVIVVLLITGLLLKIRDAEERAEEFVLASDAFFARAFPDASAGVATTEQLKLAACVLLLEATFSDGRFDEGERDHIEDMVRRRFDLDPGEVEDLLKLADEERRTPDGVGRLARLISREFTPKQKRGLLDELWVLVYTDGALSKREIEFIEDVAKLMGVDQKELVASRRRAVLVTENGGEHGE